MDYLADRGIRLGSKLVIWISSGGIAVLKEDMLSVPLIARSLYAGSVMHNRDIFFAHTSPLGHIFVFY